MNIKAAAFVNLLAIVSSMVFAESTPSQKPSEAPGGKVYQLKDD